MKQTQEPKIESFAITPWALRGWWCEAKVSPYFRSTQVGAFEVPDTFTWQQGAFVLSHTAVPSNWSNKPKCTCEVNNGWFSGCIKIS